MQEHALRAGSHSKFLQIPRAAVVTLRIVIACQWLLLLITFARPLFLGRTSPAVQSDAIVANSISKTDTKNGEPAWGRLQRETIILAAPIETVRQIDPKLYESDWYFPLMTLDELDALLTEFGVAEKTRNRIVEISEMDTTIERRRVPIINELIAEIPVDVRQKLYRYLAGDKLNEAQSNAFRFASDSFDEWFRGTRIRAKLKERVKNMVYEDGHYLVFADIRLVVDEVRGPDEMAALFQALTRVKTCLLSINVTPESNLTRLKRYWGRRGRASQIRATLESLDLDLSNRRVDAFHLLPPFARRHLYKFPDPSSATFQVGRDCHWTAHNFFNEVEDDRLANNLEELPELLDSDYYEIYGDLRLGDVIMFVDNNGVAYHSAVYIAGDIVFTKNGPDPLRPWHFCGLQEMHDFYPRRENVRMLLYRQKKS